MDAKFTPGPWAIEGYISCSHRQESGFIISAGINSYRDGPNSYVCNAMKASRADAQLITTAPDLLALVYQYRDDLRYPPRADSIVRRIEAIDAIIAKAMTNPGEV